MSSLYQHLNNLEKDNVNTVAIGSFDGIHLGHMQLINKLGDNGALCVINKNNSNLTPGIKRSEYSKCLCMFYQFSKVKELSGKEFIQLLKEEFINLKKIVVGYDFKFGKKRSCKATDLFEFFDGEVEIVEEFIHDKISVHSTYIKKLLVEGNVEKANYFLGREYSITGKIILNQYLKKEELYSDINIQVKDYFLPSDGIYNTKIKVKDKVYYSISFIKTQSSTDEKPSIKTHILDNNVNEIDEIAEIFFIKYLSKIENPNLLMNLRELTA